MITCKRCGKCCIFKGRRCIYLIGNVGEYTTCKIYRRNRLGRILWRNEFGEIIKCFDRTTKHNYPEGCAYKPIEIIK